MVQTNTSILFGPRPPTPAGAASHWCPPTDAIDERAEGCHRDVTSRIRRDFRLLPGLALTLPQARRLWMLPESACRELLDALVAEGFLSVRSDGRYVIREASRRRGQA
jgi:hypothetical protein